MPTIEIEPGIEINQIEEQIVKIRIPNCKLFVTGEKTEKSKWNLYLLDPNTNYKEIFKKGITTKNFSLFCNIVLKTPFPYAGKETNFEVIKKFIKETIKKHGNIKHK